MLNSYIYKCIRKYAFLPFILISVSFVNAAVQPEHSYPLEQILAIAASNASQLKIIDTKMEAGYAEVAMYRANAMPYLTFGSGANIVSQSQATANMQQELSLAMFSALLPPDTSGAATGGAQSGFDLPLPDRINGYAFNWGLNLQQPIITFGKIRSAIRLARMRDCTLKEMQKLERDLFFLRVIQEFSAAYLAQLDVTINKASLDRSRQLKTRLETEFSAGRTIKRELLRIEALVQGDRAQLHASKGSFTTSQKRLLQTINFGDSGSIVLTIDEYGTLTLPPPSSGPGSIQLSLKKNEAAMYKEQIKYIRSSFFPSIDLVAGINNQFMTFDTSGLIDDFIGGSSTNEMERAQRYAAMAELFEEYNPKPSKYFDPDFFNYSIGLQLNWTLFDGFRTRSQYRQAKYKAIQALLELEEMDNEQKIAIEEARNQIATIDSTLKAVVLQQEASRMALEQTERDYTDGMTDFSTLLDTDKEYRAVTRQLNGLKIQRVLALAQLRIAMGLPVYGEDK